MFSPTLLTKMSMILVLPAKLQLEVSKVKWWLYKGAALMPRVVVEKPRLEESVMELHV